MESQTRLHPSNKPTLQTMDTNTNFKISIPKPCHENWENMTPDQKGAFCKVCSKSVYDFTKKTAEEIKTVLVEQINAGAKVCGRFNEDQLSPAPQSIPDLSPYALNFARMRRFAMALFLVFGGFLFTSIRSSAQKMGKVAYREPMRGEVEVYHDPTQKKDTAKTKKDTAIAPVTNIPKCDNNMITGGLSIQPVVLGTVSAEPIKKPVETTQFMGDTIITKLNTADDETPMIMGMMVALPHDGLTKEPNPVPSDSLQQIIKDEFAVPESTFVKTEVPVVNEKENMEVMPDFSDANPAADLSLSSYPNPTSSGEITLRYALKKDAMASISLFDLNGNLVKTLLPAQSIYASAYETKYDIRSLKNGVYFCELNSGNNKATTKIVLSK